MLVELSIRNFIIIDRLNLEFRPGMTVVTGETGAGKSILLDAVEFVLGARTDVKVIRANEAQCDITAVFEVVAGHPVMECLEDLACPSEEGRIVLRRILNAEGRSKVYLNQQPVNVAQLKQVGVFLIDMVGQYEHQKLLKSEVQLASLDAFCQVDAQQIAGYFQEIKSLQEDLAALQLEQVTAQAKLELQQYQLAELQALQLQPGELDRLHEEQKKRSSVQDLLLQSAQLLGEIKEEESSLLSQAQHIEKTLLRLASDYNELSNASSLWQEACILMAEATADIEVFHKSLDLDPERLNEVESRLQEIYAAARKHQVEAHLLSDFYRDLESALDGAEAFAAVIHDKQVQLDQVLQKYDQAAASLSAARHQAAEKMAAEISLAMKQLGMPQGECYFALQTDPLSRSATGIDRLNLQVRINPGQPFAALKEVASGGELSRIALIVAVLTAQADAESTLIFDEVDVGISGAVAEQVAVLIHRLAQSRQILCITHLPQVALRGDTHLHISKRFESDATFSEATWLDREARITEVAKMISGSEISQSALDYARKGLTFSKDPLE